MRILKYAFLWLIIFVTSLVIIVASILFFNPSKIINPESINFALEKTNVLEKWSWENAELSFKWIRWNKRNIYLNLENFCFNYAHEKAVIESCFQKFKWNVNIQWGLREGFVVESIFPMHIIAEDSQIILVQKNEDHSENNSNTQLPDIMKYWKTLWSKKFPDLILNLKNVHIVKNREKYHFNLMVKKKVDQLNLSTLGFTLNANPEFIEIQAPKEFKFPLKNENLYPIFLQNFLLTGKINEKEIICQLTGYIGSLDFILNTQIPIPLNKYKDTTALLKAISSKTSAQLNISNIQSQVNKKIKSPYNQLPAPFNAMNGNIDFQLATIENEVSDEIIFQLQTKILMQGGGQNLDATIFSEIPVNLRYFEFGPLYFDVEFNKLFLKLPRLAKNALPPQMKPDPRIQSKKIDFIQRFAQKQEEETAKFPLNIWLKSKKKNSFVIGTNLLKDDIRLTFDFKINQDNEMDGYINILPLKTTIFKRKIELLDFKIVFKLHQEPELEATIKFVLPEYEITVHFEGPLSNPRYVFSSEPPLPQADIYAVLFFGRPLMELDVGDQDTASRANYILSQGLLSLAVLHLFAGTPIEAIGYDPSSNEVSAQLGLGKRGSFRIGRGESGASSFGVRYSLGGGWYVDTTSRESKNVEVKQNGARDYGILLERVIAY